MISLSGHPNEARGWSPYLLVLMLLAGIVLGFILAVLSIWAWGRWSPGLRKPAPAPPGPARA